MHCKSQRSCHFHNLHPLKLFHGVLYTDFFLSDKKGNECDKNACISAAFKLVLIVELALIRIHLHKNKSEQIFHDI